MNLNQSKFEAVKIGISLSQQLITASIGLLTIIGGGVVYLVKVDNYNYYTFIPLALSLIALLISIYYGYMGISIARNNGFRGWWCINAGRKEFNKQTIFCIIGILFFLTTTLTVFIDKKKNIDNTDKSIELPFRMRAFEIRECKLRDKM